MKKKIIGILVILMSITLTGIILIQLLWIKNAIKVKEQQFEMAVFDALDNVIELLEKKEAIYLVKKSFTEYAVDTLKTEQVFVETRVINEKDSNNIIVVNSNNETKIISKKIDFSFNEDSCNNLIAFCSNDSNVYTGDSIIMKNFSTESDSLKIMIQEIFDDKNKKVNIVLSDIMHELEYSNQPANKRFDIEILNELISEKLNDKEIDTDFEFLINSNGTIISDTTKNPAFNLEEAFAIPLFSSDIVDTFDTLFLFFPKKSNHIIKNMAFMLGGSFIFTLFIIIIFIVSIRTILKQKKMSEIKSDFINNMTHEFKTPIATISLATDSIENPQTLADKDKILYFTKVIREENQRMNNQVENVLQIALSEKKEISFNVSQYDVHDLILKAIKNIELQLKQKCGTISTELKAERILVQADKMHFTNVIFNLLDNACKYSHDEPDIYVQTHNENGYILISVKDNGIGMSKDVQNKIFEKFYRESTGNIHNVKGHGLGLSYAKAIIESFNGKILVSSELNKGSTFTIKLPSK